MGLSPGPYEDLLGSTAVLRLKKLTPMNAENKPTLITRMLKWIFRWRTLRHLLVLMVSLITLTALVLTIERWRGRKAWAKFTKEMEQKGESLDLKNFIPKKPEDSENLASLPILQSLFLHANQAQNSRSPGTSSPVSTNYSTATLQNINLQERMPKSTNRVDQSSPLKGIRTSFEQWKTFYVGNTNYPQAPAGADAATVMRAASSKYAPVLQEIRGAINRPYCVFPLRYEDTVDTLLPHLSVVKSITSLANFSALTQMAAQNPEGAFDETMLTLKIAQCLKSEPTLISQLVRIATLSLAANTAWEGLSRRLWNETQIKAIQEMVATIDQLTDYGQTVRSERAFSNLIIEGMIGGDNKLVGMLTGGQGKVLSKLNLEGMMRQNQLLINRLHQDYSLALIDATQRRAYPEKANHFEDVVKNMPRTPYNILAKMLFPALDKTAAKMARSQSTLDCLVVSCAIERYRLANGHYPDALSSLVPKWISAVPNDVIDGQPLRYQKSAGGGYILYSIGWDQIDDNGSPVGYKSLKGDTSHTRLKAAELGDWTWMVPGLSQN